MNATRLRDDEIEGVQYILSKRGTEHVLYEGNTYTPNEKSSISRSSRTWKCSMYYKFKCKARVVTRFIDNKEFLRPPHMEHTHERIFPDP